MLWSLGHEYFLASGGAQVAGLARENRPDVILMDIRLPDIAAGEALRQLRADEPTQAIPVIATTAYAGSGHADRLLKAGFDGYLSKPFTVEDLMAKITTVLGPRLSTGQ